MFLAAIAVAAVSATGCVSYEAEPLNHRALIDQIDRQRSDPAPPVASPAGTLTLTDAAIWMTQHNPEVRELRAEYDALADVAEIPTPYPNPGVEAGLVRGFRLDETVASKTQPFIGMGFAVPLGPRLEATDDLHAAEAEEPA